MIPQALVKAAIKKQANVGRMYDTSGRHVAYFLRVSDTWRVYRHSVSGMLALIRTL